jgi:hypothetical protein
MNSSGLISAWGPVTGARPMAENGLRGPCQPASPCTPDVWSPRARWCGRWMEGGEILGSCIDALRGTRRTRWWSRDLTMMEARRKGASAAVLDGGDVALVYYSDRRWVLQLWEGEEEVRGKMKQLKSLVGGAHWRDAGGSTMCRRRGRVKSRWTCRASGQRCPWEALGGHHGPVRLLLKGGGAVE